MKKHLIGMMIAGGLLATGAPGWAQEAKQDKMSQDKMAQGKMDDQANMPHDKKGDNSQMKHKKPKHKTDKMDDTKDKMKGM